MRRDQYTYMRLIHICDQQAGLTKGEVFKGGLSKEVLLCVHNFMVPTVMFDIQISA